MEALLSIDLEQESSIQINKINMLAFSKIWKMSESDPFFSFS